MPPVLERIVQPKENRISLDIPEELGGYTFRIVMIPVGREEPKNYDFTDLAGRLQWSGDAVAEQRRLRDEW